MQNYPYGLTADEVEVCGGSVSRALDAKLAREAAAPPEAVVWEWNTKNRYWGELWAEVKYDSKNGWCVVAGISGCLSGIVVARMGENACARFAQDFQDGKVFCLDNAEEWVRYINAANAAKPIPDMVPADRGRSRLLSLAREEGFALDGTRFNRESLREFYKTGNRF